MTFPRTTRCLMLIAAAAVALTGCASESMSADAVEKAEATTSTTTSTTVVEEEFVPAATWSAVLETEAGDSQQFVLDAGAFSRIAEAADIGTLTPEDITCGVDPERDFVAPFTFRIKNSTDGFSRKVGLAIYGQVEGGDANTPVLTAYAAYSDGGQCQEITGYSWIATGATNGRLSLSSRDSLEPGEQVQISGYFVARDMASPAFPDGDPAYLADRVLFLNETPINDSTGKIVSSHGAWEKSLMALHDLRPSS